MYKHKENNFKKYDREKRHTNADMVTINCTYMTSEYMYVYI